MISFARAGPDEAHEAGRRRDAERHAEVDLGNPELRFGGGPAEVAGERQTPAAADRVAVDHRDRRLLEALQQRVGALEQPPELALALTERLAPLVRRHRRLEPGVGSRREHRRRAGHDDDARRGVVAQLHERRGQLAQHRVAQRVAAIGTAQGDGRDRAVACKRDIVAHARGRYHRRLRKKVHLLRWRPRPHAQRTESTPRARPSGAASHLDLFAPPAGVNFAGRSGEDVQRRLGRAEAGEDRGGWDAQVARGDLGEEVAEVRRHREVAALEAAGGGRGRASDRRHGRRARRRRGRAWPSRGRDRCRGFRSRRPSGRTPTS